MEQHVNAPYKRVMIVDDTYVDRYVAERVIKKYSFAEDIISVESALDALDYLIAGKDHPEELPELIFLDINMPEMNGFEFLEKYKELPETIKKHCIIMMLTTSLHEEDMKQALANPYVYRFLNKPLTFDRLKEITLQPEKKDPQP